MVLLGDTHTYTKKYYAVTLHEITPLTNKLLGADCLSGISGSTARAVNAHTCSLNQTRPLLSMGIQGKKNSWGRLKFRSHHNDNSVWF